MNTYLPHPHHYVSPHFVWERILQQFLFLVRRETAKYLSVFCSRRRAKGRKMLFFFTDKLVRISTWQAWAMLFLSNVSISDKQQILKYKLPTDYRLGPTLNLTSLPLSRLFETDNVIERSLAFQLKYFCHKSVGDITRSCYSRGVLQRRRDLDFLEINFLCIDI